MSLLAPERRNPATLAKVDPAPWAIAALDPWGSMTLVIETVSKISLLWSLEKRRSREIA